MGAHCNYNADKHKKKEIKEESDSQIQIKEKEQSDIEIQINENKEYEKVDENKEQSIYHVEKNEKEERTISQININENKEKSISQNQIDKNSVKKIKDSHIPITGKTLSIIMEQFNNICKIFCDKSTGTGFFCLIPFPNKYTLISVLITNYHILNENDISINKKIKFLINKDKSINEILINDSRKTYTSKLYDITIIEIKKSDGINLNSILKIDNQIFKDISNDIYIQKSIYILHYPDNNPEYSAGVIKEIKKNDNFTIEHKCQTEYGSSGAPILDLITNCVIGVHKGCPKSNNNWNLGSLIKRAIQEFNTKNGKIIDADKIIEKNKIIDEITIRYNYFNRNICNKDIDLYKK